MPAYMHSHLNLQISSTGIINMANEQRLLLEQLMGRDALLSPSTKRREVDITNPRVCKAFLVGSCPHDMFAGTKNDMGKCPSLHLEKHKLEYEYRTKKKGEKFPQFELEYLRILRKYIEDIDFNIATAFKRLEHTPAEQATIAAAQKDLEVLDTKIGLMTSELQYLADANEIQKSLEHSTLLESVIKEREVAAEQVRVIAENVGQSAQQKLQVCEVCGAYLSRLDNDRRLADHFIGKTHLVYAQMRETYEMYNTKFGKAPSSSAKATT